MTDIDIFDFCERHDIEISFRFEKETGRYGLRIRRGVWQYDMIVTPEQIDRTSICGTETKGILCYLVNKLDHEENARKNQIGGAS